MPNTAADTIRILVTTDSHVGYNERDAIRGNDSWKSFHEVMCLANEHDVDMVLHAGDLFHENKPSRKAMYEVMRSLRMCCYGDKPCELEMLSDASENFEGAFDHVNYEDADINVAVPFFAIHGNHDDPSGTGSLAALDILQMSGLVNYFGRIPEADKIDVKPVLLQKGNTKLALYGLSNVRDERLFRTFRDGHVKFFQPNMQKDDWFNLMCVHQNHHPYTETGYLPQKFLPSFLDLVIWGHEHECKIEPVKDPEQGFYVMQPGSSVATSLVPGEAETKYVSLLTISGKDFESKKLRLKSVRPFIMREIVLADAPAMRKVVHKDNNRPDVTRYLNGVVAELIEEAKQQWFDAQEEDGAEADEDLQPPAPLVRLRVEYTAPEGGNFDIENPQRFSSQFQGKVANTNDVVQFHRKKKATRNVKVQAEMPDESTMAALSIDTIKVDKLVREFLTAQSLTILPQNSFGDAVAQFVDKDDKHAMEMFVQDSLKAQVEQLVGDEDEVDEQAIFDQMEAYKAKLEDQFTRGELKKSKRKGSRKPKPMGWDSDEEGHWEDSYLSLVHVNEEGRDEDEDDGAVAPTARTGQGGRVGRGAKGTTGTTRKAPAKATNGRGKKKQPIEEESDEEEDVIMLDDDDEEEDDDSQALFVKPAAKKASSSRTAPAASKSTAAKKPPTKRPTGAQQTLNFSQVTNGSPTGPASRTGGRSARATAPPKKLREPSEDEISDDDDDAFEPAPTIGKGRTGGRR